MDVFLMVRRHKTTIFLDAKESTQVLELKKMIQPVIKKVPEEIKLYKDDQNLDDHKTLGDCGFTSATARAQAPATIGMCFKNEDGDFEPLEIAALSVPPELPDVMKPQDTAGHHPEAVSS
jgi:transcription elongation factor B subunit 2